MTMLSCATGRVVGVGAARVGGGAVKSLSLKDFAQPFLQRVRKIPLPSVNNEKDMTLIASISGIRNYRREVRRGHFAIFNSTFYVLAYALWLRAAAGTAAMGKTDSGSMPGTWPRW